VKKSLFILVMLIYSSALTPAQDSTWQQIKIEGKKMSILTYSLTLEDGGYALSANASFQPEEILLALANSTKRIDSIAINKKISRLSYSIFDGNNKKILSQNYLFKNGKNIYDKEIVLRSERRTPYEAYSYLLNLVLVISFGFFGRGMLVKRSKADQARLEYLSGILDWLYIITPGVIGSIFIYFTLPDKGGEILLACIILATASVYAVGILYNFPVKKFYLMNFLSVFCILFEMLFLILPVSNNTAIISLTEIHSIFCGFLFLGILSYVIGKRYQEKQNTIP